MSFKTLLRTLVFLAILFVVLYIGMNNQQGTEFSFPLALSHSIHEPAALIYFALFAIGVLAGTMLHGGGGGGGSKK
jgi:uncharacterized membrane protein YciS (DUF1049 family)